MTQSKRKTKKQSRRAKGQIIRSTLSGKKISHLGDASERDEELPTLTNTDFTKAQTTLSDKRIPLAERRSLAVQTSELQGNRHLQHLVGQTLLVQRQDDTMEMEPMTITGERGGFAKQVVNDLKDASARAQGNAGQFAQQVESACEAFENYANPKLADIEGEITAGDLVGILLPVVLAPIGGAVTAKIASTTAKALAGAVIGQLNKAVTNAAKDAATDSSNLDALKQAITSLTQGARDSATQIQTGVKTIFEPRINDIIIKLNAGEPLTPADDDFVGPFYMAPLDNVDATLEEMGIPSKATAEQIQLEIFEGLVKKFEEKYIWIQASFREKLEMGFARDFGAEELTLGYKASQKAKAAAKKRKSALAAAKR